MRVVALRVSGGCLLLAWCGWASAFHTGTWDARITWWISTLTVCGAWVLVRGDRGGDRQVLGTGGCAVGEPTDRGNVPRVGVAAPGSLLSQVWPWLALTAVVVVWEALGIATGPHQPHLTISALSQAFRSIHAALLATWMGVGLLWVAATSPQARLAAGPSPSPSPSPSPGPGPGPGPGSGPGQEHADAREAGRRYGRGRHVLGAAMIGVLRPVSTLASTPYVAVHRWGGGSGTIVGVLLPSSRAVGVGFWLGVVGVAVGVDAVSRIGPGRHATFTGLLRLLWLHPVVRTVVVVAWLGAGWHLFSH